MNYVESFNLFGVEAMQIPCIRGYGAPTTATEGNVGLFYMDRDSGATYKCTAVNDGVYTWEVFDGPQGPKGDDGYTPVRGVDYWTDADKQELVGEVLAALPVAEGVEF